ncbi:hypothetical protein E1B28_006199 [Marasmius oreades]|uniref:Major facilitator superfamily (MFS) profile domain-containing protein n=1 Tax=Marasmius oreades TaxID=181124 RepID=A0A9P7S4V8_9AGAR|nr:uncharacterized protein E1B28_006199 [Marasmius oreades]KAG7095459.1 hypothetical protein E1B28_006199 [Marasmius oreades]
MPSLTVATPNIVEPVVPDVHRNDDALPDPSTMVNESHDLDESAVDDDHVEMPVHPPRAKNRSVFGGSLVERKGSEAAYELQPFPTYFSERTRRPSAIRKESTPETLVEARGTLGKDGRTEPAEEGVTDLPLLDLSEAAQEYNVRRGKRQKRGAISHLAALYYAFFLEGWNDGTIGPLLPVMQREYRVGFAVVSLLFVTNCVGFVAGAFINVYVNDRMGFGKVMVLGSLFQLIAYIIQSPAPPFPVMVMSYFFAGLGLSFQNAQGNGFVGSLPSPSLKLMMLHASYGLGAFASPLLSTYFSGKQHWSRHFVVSACIAVTNTAVLIAVFRGKTQNELMRESGIQVEDHAAARCASAAGPNIYRQIFNLRAIYFMATFALIYIGVEVTVGGWIVTFIIEKRDGGHSAGYISSGFFGGLTIGRLGLMWMNKRVNIALYLSTHCLPLHSRLLFGLYPPLFKTP